MQKRKNKAIHQQLSFNQLGKRENYEDVSSLPTYEKRRRQIIKNWLKKTCQEEKKSLLILGADTVA